MSHSNRLSVARISEELGIHMDALNNLWKAWRLQREVMPACGKEPQWNQKVAKRTAAQAQGPLAGSGAIAYRKQDPGILVRGLGR
jgi:hypothetical protein